jgi:transposase
MSASLEFDLHYRLRPIVREIALARLERRGLGLDSGSPAVLDLLGEDLWKLVSPDREPPRNRQAVGPGIAQLRQTVESLERL